MIQSTSNGSSYETNMRLAIYAALGVGQGTLFSVQVVNVVYMGGGEGAETQQTDQVAANLQGRAYHSQKGSDAPIFSCSLH